jgi:hypothetical protein
MRKKTGKKAARTTPFPLTFAFYLNAAQLPPVPAVFPHATLLDRLADWQMLANGADGYGDCVWAGAAHETMLIKASAGFPTPAFTDADVLSDYSAVTGFKISDPDSDQGTDVQQAAAYRQQTGVLDAALQRHKIDAYAALRVGDLDQLALAAYLFGAVGVGVQCPDSMEDQFDHMEVWDVVRGDKVDGGHYIPCIGRNGKGNLLFVSWGRLQAATPKWVETYCDEAYAYISRERINQLGLSAEGFNYQALMDDFSAVTA